MCEDDPTFKGVKLKYITPRDGVQGGLTIVLKSAVKFLNHKAIKIKATEQSFIEELLTVLHIHCTGVLKVIGRNYFMFDSDWPEICTHTHKFHLIILSMYEIKSGSNF